MAAIRRSLLVFLAVIELGCTSGIPKPTQLDVARASRRWPGTTGAELSRGRALYLGRCAGCHNLYRPEARAPEQWPKIVRDMAGPAGLGPKEIEAIERYLVIASTSSGPGRNPRASTWPPLTHHPDLVRGGWFTPLAPGRPLQLPAALEPVVRRAIHPAAVEDFKNAITARPARALRPRTAVARCRDRRCRGSGRRTARALAPSGEAGWA